MTNGPYAPLLSGSHDIVFDPERRLLEDTEPEVLRISEQTSHSVSTAIRPETCPIGDLFPHLLDLIPTDSYGEFKSLLPEVMRSGNFNTRDGHGNTLLTIACRHCLFEIVLFLLDLPNHLRPEVNVRDYGGYPLLHLFADIPTNQGILSESDRISMIDAIRSLIDADIDINLQDNEGNTALSHALKGRNDIVIRELLILKELIDAKKNGVNPLLVRIAKDVSLYRFLKENNLLSDFLGIPGIDPAYSEFGKTASMLAMENGNIEFFHLLSQTFLQKNIPMNGKLNQMYYKGTQAEGLAGAIFDRCE